jgi:hypothetical protein
MRQYADATLIFARRDGAGVQLNHWNGFWRVFFGPTRNNSFGF